MSARNAVALRARPPSIPTGIEKRRDVSLWNKLTAHIPGTVFQLLERPDGHSCFPYVSHSICEDYGLQPATLQEDASSLLACIHQDDIAAFRQSLQQSKAAMQPWRHEFRMLLPDNRVRWHMGSAQPESLRDGSVLWHGYIEDITEKLACQDMLWRNAHHDVLTGLPNRLHFLGMFEQEIRHAKQSGTRLALIVLDLDQFKDINEILGHNAGDILLRHVAQRLKSFVSDICSVSRLGGDEFIFMMKGIASAADVEPRASEILTKLSEPFLCSDTEIHVSASIGVAVFPEDAESSQDLLMFSERAMYSAKQDGRNRYRFFMPAMQEGAQQKMALVKELRRALADYPFRLLYQPIVELATGKVTKLEALIRWQHPVRGLVSPSEFIPVAEETGMIGELSNWVFHQAVQDVMKWRATLHPELSIGINLSPVLFRRGDKSIQSWVEHISHIGLPGSAIVAEITEGMLLASSDSVIKRFDSLRNAGIMIAMDDFGTGYSSLSYLKKFEIGCIKIDKAFIQNLSPGSSDLALCEAIIVMAHKLGLCVIAEGVETEAQRDLLAAAGCDYGQGYLFSRPLPASEIEAWMTARVSGVGI